MPASTSFSFPIRLFRNIGELVWPRTCLLCDTALNHTEKYLCFNCLANLPRTNYHLKPDNRITRLALPLAPEVRSANWFYYHHDTPGHILIHTIKYHDRPRLARYLGREFALELKQDSFFENNPVDIILPIPLHWTRFVKRTYNQAAEIAHGIADITDIKVGDNLYALKRHVSQTRRDRESRALNVENIYGIRHPEEIDGKHIAILDDIITTGATITSAAKALKVAGVTPASLTFLSLGITRLR